MIEKRRSLPSPRLGFPRAFTEVDLEMAELCGLEGVPLRVVLPRFLENWDRAVELWRELFEIRRYSFTRLRLTKAHKAFNGDGDQTDIPMFETFARALANEYPQHLGAGEHTDTTTQAERLYEILKLTEQDYLPNARKLWQGAIDSCRPRPSDVRKPRRPRRDKVPF